METTRLRPRATVNPGQAQDIALSPDGTRAFVTSSAAGVATVVDTVTNAVLYTVRVGSGPYGIAVGPGGSKVCVVNSGSNTVSVLAPESGGTPGGAVGRNDLPSPV